MKKIQRLMPKFIIGAALLLLLPAQTHADSLWKDDTSRPMFADKRGVNVGDILTIMVQENSTANKDNGTTTERQSSLTAAITSQSRPIS